VCALAQAGFTPAFRPTYDYIKYDPHRQDCTDASSLSADHGRCGPSDGPDFNSFINTPSWGDERAFFDAYRSDQGPRSTADILNVSGAGEAILRIYVNNDANEHFGYRTIASGTTVRVTIPTGAANALRARAYISAENALPSEVTDTTELVSSRKFRVVYVPGRMINIVLR